MARSEGEGWAAAELADLGEGPGFRKLRRELGIKAFGMNAIVIPAGYATGRHFHERQEETYFVHRGTLEFELGDEGASETVRLGEGGTIRVDAATVRKVTNVGDSDATYVVVGGADGYVGRDGKAPDGGPAGPRGAR